jgi:hypothetical protein
MKAVDSAETLENIAIDGVESYVKVKLYMCLSTKSGRCRPKAYS